MLIDDFASADLVSRLGTRWQAVSDQVMGGISEPQLARAESGGRMALHLSGDVRLENNGGFIQAALDLDRAGGCFDASGYSGLRLTVRGNGETYGLHLRSADTQRPWQSYRAGFQATASWQEIVLPFGDFRPHRLEAPLDLTRLRRLGLAAIGRAFHADLWVADLAFYR
ncbi:MAG: hypothetical protein Kow00114_09040 [Kiloniellaceae bacterium]